MPTPSHVFARVAARIGGVDATDSEAVQRWYMETLPWLSPGVIDEVLRELHDADGTPATKSLEPSYPLEAPLPTLDESPEARIPGWWFELRGRLRRLLRR